MRDIAAWLVEAGSLLGRDASLHADGRLPVDDRAVNLVVAPHEFYPLGDFTNREIDDAARISTPVCTEQPGTTWFDVSRLLCRASGSVVDINAHGARALRRHGHDAVHLRLGGVPSMDRRLADDDRSRELLFLGGRTPRRGRLLATLAPQLWNREVDLRMFSFRQPVQDGAGGLVFGRDKYDLLADSRILLNIHRDEAHPGYFEWARMVEAMANGCCVVTEPSTGHEPLTAGVHFVEADDELVGQVAALLDDPDRASAIGERAAEAVLHEWPLTATLAPVLDRIESRHQPRRSLIAPRYDSETVRAQQIPVLPAFTPHPELRHRIYRALMAETALQRRLERARSLVRHGRDDHVERVTSASYDAAAPEVTVVVTLYDYAELVTETLDSIAASEDVDVEIVVVDDHSNDTGRAVVRAWIDAHPDVPALLLGSDINRGLPAARNLGFEHARAADVMVMDADNLVYPSALRRLADALDADPDAAFAYSALEEFGSSTGIRSAMAWHVPWLCEGNYIDAQAMIRREAWARHGGYRVDDEVFGWEDWELWLRLAAQGEHGVHVPQMLGRYRTQEQSMIATTNLVADHMLRYLRGLYPTLPWPSA
ncbi:MAG: glycosyltransferase [Ilumatobacter sp.]|uniref:glycosyltransferase n=1 Tax=Ilumatobacter sp. TaxID=1967498 RepID=UPI00262FD84A|nr:glycosyltransferase [Ilumatobacter sp.]MDJ0768343.1 glycosyltransferase [Ilumatobacter sp.]